MTTEALDQVGLPAPVVSDDVKPEPPEGTAPEGSEETKQAEPPKTFTQAEVDALVQKRLLKEERKVHRRIEQQLREQAEAQTRQVEPQRDSFRDEEAYLQAQVEHLAEKRAAEKLAERERAIEAEKRAESFIEKAEKAQDRYPDFQAVVSNPMLSINNDMAEFIAESDLGADVAYFLGKNPAKAREISQLSPVKAARELTRIESELAARPKASLSKAPEPITPVGTRGAASGRKDPSEMSDAEFAKWRKSQIAQRN